MTLLFVILLAVLWGAVFAPAILRARQETSPIVSIGSFKRGMRALGGRQPANGRWVLMPPRPEQTRSARRTTLERRRRVFIALIGGSALTFVLGMIPAFRGLLGFHLAIDLMLAGYVTLLMQMKRRTTVAKRPQLEEESEVVYAQAGHF